MLETLKRKSRGGDPGGRSKIRLPKFKDSILLLPNLLTSVRILLIPFIVILMYKEWKMPEGPFGFFAAWIFIFAAITDFLDGYIARKMKMKSTVGKVMDPLADKLMVISILVMLIPIGRVPAFLVVIIIAREFIITSLRTLASVAGIIIPAGRSGKAKALFQMVAITLLLFDSSFFYMDSMNVGILLLWIAVVFSVISALIYMREFFRAAGDLEF